MWCHILNKTILILSKQFLSVNSNQFPYDCAFYKKQQGERLEYFFRKKGEKKEKKKFL